ncbi:creatininase family protein [Bradyrhizobium canariense]|uniref:Creatinine amidohydrolase n=1 Tax=Bradyrhizobium canariense TaxID=255045 RepID=A0A1H2AKF5_9BRAD|nr:creatininase family protein [Bradyrhizobium canariense]SDT46344.1 creatinine amidohydrolase [Bradyrhizobium canariense]
MSEPRSTEAHSIFQDTIANMTFPDLAKAAADRAVVLWGLGVIEQHGPHLPLGTDVYMPSELLRRVRKILASKGVASVIMPPFYWGVNQVSGLFPGSFMVRPEVMIELMVDLIKSLKKDSFSTLFCVSGHGDALHNRTIFDGVCRGADESGLSAHFVGAPSFFKRIGIDPASPRVLPTMTEVERNSKYFDVHAGEFETSSMWAVYPDLVKDELLPTLKSTDFGIEDLTEWRKGGEHALRKTPQGYLGDPAASSRELGERMMAEHAEIVAEAIAAKVAAVV